MPFCPNCGSQVEGRFCARCGTAVDAGAAPGQTAPGQQPPAYQAPPQQAYQMPPQAAPASAGMTDNVAGALCYLVGWITGVLFLVLQPYNQNKTVRFHAFQSIFFNIAWIALWIIVWIGSAIVMMIPFLRFLSILIWLVDLVLLLAGVALWLFLMYKAYSNQKFVLPVVGPLAEKQA